jgi:hypothetical protein
LVATRTVDGNFSRVSDDLWIIFFHDKFLLMDIALHAFDSIHRKDAQMPSTSRCQFIGTGWVLERPIKKPLERTKQYIGRRLCFATVPQLVVVGGYRYCTACDERPASFNSVWPLSPQGGSFWDSTAPRHYRQF